MPKPDVALHNPDPNYVRDLIARAGLSQRGAARLLGEDERSMRYWCSGDRTIPYVVQFCLEVLATAGPGSPRAP